MGIDSLFQKVADFVEQARKRVATAVNVAEVYTKYHIGQYIVETVLRKSIHEKKSATVSRISDINENDSHCLSNSVPTFTLSWSHYLILMRIENPDARSFYEMSMLRLTNFICPTRHCCRQK